MTKLLHNLYPTEAMLPRQHSSRHHLNQRQTSIPLAHLTRGHFTWCRRVRVPLAIVWLASCGETRTRSSCAETWRRSSSSARVSFSNCASCSLTEARILAVDSTSESSMVVKAPHGGREGARQGDATGVVGTGVTQKGGWRGEETPHFTIQLGRKQEERERERSWVRKERF